MPIRLEMRAGQLSGVYLVVDPTMPAKVLLDRLEEAMAAGVSMVQIWDHWPSGFSEQEQLDLCVQVKSVGVRYGVRVLMNENYRLALVAGLDGVHFDRIPEDWPLVGPALNNYLVGITCGNNLEVVRWAENQQVDYLSFCAMFPSGSVDTCELVNPEMVRKARKLTGMPIFLSGGMNVPNILRLQDLDFQGVAVISGIMSASVVAEAVKEYKEVLNQKFYEKGINK